MTDNTAPLLHHLSDEEMRIQLEDAISNIDEPGSDASYWEDRATRLATEQHHRLQAARKKRDEAVIDDDTDDAWQAIADALGNLGYDLNSHEDTVEWIQRYLFRAGMNA